jgi:alkanesulfonate monooxygenase SsuD/methylene tetrahydromethanopterin reductase-like flavin-dependent oxidoreductase (luciferase family)
VGAETLAPASAPAPAPADVPPSLGWIVQPALFDTPPGEAPGSWNLARAILNADEGHFPLAIEAGFDTIWVEDHMGWGDKSHLECLTTLAWLAGRHPSPRWGTMVCGQAFRNPAYLAKVAVNLQLLTNGQFILGLGAGNNGAEHEAFGFPFPPAGHRVDEMEEAIRILRALWLGGPQTVRGRTYEIDGAVVAPAPEPAIPLMVGGGGERRTLRVVADLADWWCADVGTVAAFSHKSAVLERHCRELGRDPATIVRTQVAWISLIERPADAPPWPDVHIISGSPTEVAQELLQFRRAGADHLQVRFMDFPSTAGLGRFTADVLPRLQRDWD